MPERGPGTRARRALLAAALLLVAATAALHAQSRDEPHLVFTIYGGLNAGSALWDLPAQALLVPGSSQEDTVALARRLRPGLVAGVLGTYYRSAHFGWTVDIGYFGFSSEQRCQGPAAYKPDASSQNEQLCTTANGQHVATSVVGLLGGATYRFAPGALAQPFVRATAGPGLLANSYVETTGFLDPNSAACQFGCAVAILRDKDPSQLTWLVSFTAGATIFLAPAYRFRFEARDVITALPVVTGPKDPHDNASFAATGRSVRHVLTFLFGLDVVLERRHTRRY